MYNMWYGMAWYYIGHWWRFLYLHYLLPLRRCSILKYIFHDLCTDCISQTIYFMLHCRLWIFLHICTMISFGEHRLGAFEGVESLCGGCSTEKEDGSDRSSHKIHLWKRLLKEEVASLVTSCKGDGDVSHKRRGWGQCCQHGAEEEDQSILSGWCTDFFWEKLYNIWFIFHQ